MKKILLLLSLFLALFTAQSQTVEKSSKWDFVGESAVSAGFGMGGNSPFGADMELMFLPRFSAQLGLGVSGFSAGLNYHFYPTISSPFFSLQAWQSGFGNNYKAIYLAPMFVYRANKIFQAGLGLGILMDKKTDYQPKSNYLLAVNLGIYLPL